ncbi:hypothetical protein L6164_006245 [Bauhinia variegata]|uniref:Uncharacterized protein n=1 Tax=Bauhinia variegata TaxID=167791 RepID=A0ACB9PVX6_BAUVA|nr:hypothetical protein L6164_006245 [Bauhinia variegata]
MASNSIFNSESDEDTWIININNMLTDTDLNVLNNIPVCVYHVPKSLSCVKPEAFIPQLIAIGPYNHFVPELYPMERFKIYSAKRVLSHFDNLELKQLVERLGKLGPYIRASYHKYIDLKNETLLYIMAIDGLFLLDFLQNYLQQESSSSFFGGLQQLAVTCGVKLTKDAIVKDVIMLENQMPTRMMRKILKVESSKPKDSVDEELGSMLLAFCKKHSPVVLCQSPSCSEAVKRHHLLDLMYHLIVSQDDIMGPPPFEVQGTDQNPEYETDSRKRSKSGKPRTLIALVLTKLRAPLDWTLNCLEKLKDMEFSMMKPIKKPIEGILRVCNHDMGSESVSDERELPAVMVIPSVSELHEAGIRFRAATGGITTIEFDEKLGIFYLPVVKVDVNSEVIMRNLVAYEALTNSESLIFTRYTELMRGIIDSVEDVELLVKMGVIVNRLGPRGL